MDSSGVFSGIPSTALMSNHNSSVAVGDVDTQNSTVDENIDRISSVVSYGAFQKDASPLGSSLASKPLAVSEVETSSLFLQHDEDQSRLEFRESFWLQCTFAAVLELLIWYTFSIHFSRPLQ